MKKQLKQWYNTQNNKKVSKKGVSALLINKPEDITDTLINKTNKEVNKQNEKNSKRI